MSKHTPGPWEYQEELPSGPSLAQCTTIYAHGDVIGTVYESPGKGNAQANARIATAGPELLAALKVAFEHIDGGRGIRTGQAWHVMRDQIIAAIQRAEGQT